MADTPTPRSLLRMVSHHAASCMGAEHLRHAVGASANMPYWNGTACGQNSRAAVPLMSGTVGC